MTKPVIHATYTTNSVYVMGSQSGKSNLALNAILAEAMRRYLDEIIRKAMMEYQYDKASDQATDRPEPDPRRFASGGRTYPTGSGPSR